MHLIRDSRGCAIPSTQPEAVLPYLELVLLSLGSRAGVEKINSENLLVNFVSTSVCTRKYAKSLNAGPT